MAGSQQPVPVPQPYMAGRHFQPTILPEQKGSSARHVHGECNPLAADNQSQTFVQGNALEGQTFKSMMMHPQKTSIPDQIMSIYEFKMT